MSCIYLKVAVKTNKDEDYTIKNGGNVILKGYLDRAKEISVSTFRADDVKGIAPRTLYEKFGFVADELIEEFDYPNQKFVLFPVGAERKARQMSINSMVWKISQYNYFLKR